MTDNKQWLRATVTSNKQNSKLFVW